MFWISQRRALLVEEASWCWWPSVCFSPAKLLSHPGSHFSLVYCPALFIFCLLSTSHSLMTTLALLHMLNNGRQGCEEMAESRHRTCSCRKNRSKCREKKDAKTPGGVFIAINVFTCLNKTSEMSSCCYRLLSIWPGSGNMILTVFISEYCCACKHSGCSVKFSD